MAKSLTVRADDDLVKELEALAQKSKRSKNYLANEALRHYLGLSETTTRAIPVVTSLDDLAGDFWPEDDGEDFLAFLSAERQRSRDELKRDLE